MQGWGIKLTFLSQFSVDRSLSSRIGGSFRVIRDISRHEGGVAAFYRGLSPNIIGNSTSWALYFLCYGKAKEVARTFRAHDGQDLTSSDYFAASGTAGMDMPLRKEKPAD